MIEIGVLGKNSYIGTTFCDFLRGSSEYNVNTISSRDGEWDAIPFNKYSVILCTVGIAHVSTASSMEQSYYEINRDLPVKIAEKAKREGVKQFIFLSSMIVYGKDYRIGKPFIITRTTKPMPDTFYGNSKLQAEQLLMELQDENFSVAIVRTPMVYGPGCRGNFRYLIGMAKQSPVFPVLSNKRSMIFILNLCAFLRLAVERRHSGIFFPQNSEQVSTTDIIRVASKILGRNIWFTRLFNPFLYLLSFRLTVVNKIFGTKVYDMSLSPDVGEYNLYGFRESISLSMK